MEKLSVRTQQVIVIAITIVLGTITVLVTNDRPQAAPQPAAVKAQVQVYRPIPAPTVDLEEIWVSVNKEREVNGLRPLVRDPLLDKSAQAKCDDMVAKDYWSHNDPDGNTPWHFIYEQVGKYQTAGENLAYGFKDGDSVVSGWMKSEGHKANILNISFTNVGYAQCKYTDKSKQGKFTLIVQHFILPQ